MSYKPLSNDPRGLLEDYERSIILANDDLKAIITTMDKNLNVEGYKPVFKSKNNLPRPLMNKLVAQYNVLGWGKRLSSGFVNGFTLAMAKNLLHHNSRYNARVTKDPERSKDDIQKELLTKEVIGSVKGGLLSAGLTGVLTGLSRYGIYFADYEDRLVLVEGNKNGITSVRFIYYNTSKKSVKAILIPLSASVRKGQN